MTDAATESTNTYDSYGNITNIVKNIGSWDGTALTTIETETTATTYSVHNTPVPALPDFLTEKRGRVGKGISAQAPHGTVLESLPSHGSSHSVEKELTT